MKTIVTGVFDSTATASAAVAALVAAGHEHQSISVVFPDSEAERAGGVSEDEGRAIVDAHARKPGWAPTLGAVMGASGMAIGATLLLPGLLAIGPLAALLLGAGSGALSGGLLGKLMGIGISRDLAEVYHRSLEGGSVMVGVDAESELAPEVHDTLVRNGARALTQVEFA